jgi:hypothetical protein
MYDNGKFQVCVGGCGAVLSWVSGLSFSQDIAPVISGIGMSAGCFIGLHGCYVIVKRWFTKMKERNDTWY